MEDPRQLMLHCTNYHSTGWTNHVKGLAL